MMGRNKRGIRGTSMRVRLAVAAAVLVGGGAAGVAVAMNHSGPVDAASAGYHHSYSNTTLTESQAMSNAMNMWSKSPQESLTFITEMVTIKTISITPYHNHTLDVQRGVVLTKDWNAFVTKSSNGSIQLWHTNNDTKFVNIGGNKTGWNAMTGGTMSSYGDYNWSNMSNSKWNMSTKSLAKGDLVFVFGEKVHGELWAQLVLFAAPGTTVSTNHSSSSSSSGNWSSQGGNNTPTPSSTMPTFAGTNS